MAKTALTTIDNPYDPFEQFDEWFAFDNLKGYGCCSYLARFARTSDSLSEKENDDEIERAIDRIVEVDPTRMYKKFTKK